jgi:hypothetical protein
MIKNEALLSTISFPLREAVSEVHEAVKAKTDILLLYGDLKPEQFKAIQAQGKKITTVNKLRTEAGMNEIDETANIEYMGHKFIGHHTKDTNGHAKGVTFTAATHYNIKPVRAYLRDAAQKVAESRGLDFWHNENAVYLGVKEGDAVL